MAWLQRKLTEPRNKYGAGCGRSLVLMIGNHKRFDISIAKFTAETREVGEACSTVLTDRTTKPAEREGALL